MKPVGLACILSLLSFLPMGTARAARDCYDLAETLAQWEGIRTQVAQTRSGYEKNLMVHTQKKVEQALKEWAAHGASPQAIDPVGAMQQVTSSCYASSLKILLAHGISPNLPLSDDTPLRTTATSLICEERSASEVTEVLLQKGARVDDRDRTGQTALMRAALVGRQGVLTSLLTHGARVEWADCMKRTALHWGAAAGEFLAVETLLKHGANIHAKDAHGQTALQLAARFVQRPLVTAEHYDAYEKTIRLLQQAELQGVKGSR